MTAFLGASLGLQSGVSPSGMSPGGARRSERAGLSVDVLLDDRQRCTTTADGEVGRRPEVAAHVGADTRAGKRAPHRVRGAAFEALHQDGDRQSWRVGHEQMHVVSLAVELDQFGVEFGAEAAHGVLGEGEHRIGEHRAPVFRYEHQVCVQQQRHAVSRAAIGRCQWPPLRLRCG
jgi:hypothetical protein